MRHEPHPEPHRPDLPHTDTRYVVRWNGGQSTPFASYPLAASWLEENRGLGNNMRIERE